MRIPWLSKNTKTICRSENELEAQRETAKQSAAAAAAESRFQEAQTTQGMALLTAKSRIEELRAAQMFTFTCGREADDLRKQLATVEKEKAEAIAAKEKEITVLQTHIDDHESEMGPFWGEAVDACRAKIEVIAEKNRIYQNNPSLSDKLASSRHHSR